MSHLCTEAEACGKEDHLPAGVAIIFPRKPLGSHGCWDLAVYTTLAAAMVLADGRIGYAIPPAAAALANSRALSALYD